MLDFKYLSYLFDLLVSYSECLYVDMPQKIHNQVVKAFKHHKTVLGMVRQQRIELFAVLWSLIGTLCRWEVPATFRQIKQIQALLSSGSMPQGDGTCPSFSKH